MDTTASPEPTTADVTTDAATIVAGLSRSEKISLMSGADFWHGPGLPDHGVPSIMLTDGPHGLRKQVAASDRVELADSVPATCFPTAVGLGSTWDVDLLGRIGAALGRESRAEEVGVLLGPGLNIKRHPAGGRNFEYFSEDPFLAGKAAAALVRGIQSEGVGASIKHYAANNQEAFRMRVDTIVDERTLREIYLTGFEIAVKESNPWTVMSAYNLVNGEHAGESRRLLTDILRDEWGFDGLVMSDWLAVADRPRGIHAGMDLEMPGSGGTWDDRIEAALEAGDLDEVDLDLACTRVVALVLRAGLAASVRNEEAGDHVDLDAHHDLAREAAAAATVLLTNDGILPLDAPGSIAVIGAFAAQPRYQGNGSSLVTPTRLDTALDAFRERLGADADVVYVPGYDVVTGESTPAQLEAARVAASEADVAVLLVGLPASHESEGFDRTDLALPADHDRLVDVVTTANEASVVVLVNGAPVELPWADRPAAVLEAYLGGQAGGSALVDVLLGEAEPGGRLAESFPIVAANLPSDRNFANHPTQVEYREGPWVGYRFHDTFGVAPRFAFGHGLGYTTFDHDEVAVTGTGTSLTVSALVTNTGDRRGSDVVQVYVHDVESTVTRPDQELKGFTKVTLDPGESTQVEIRLDARSFAIYDVAASDWLVEGGAFEIRVGSSSRAIHATITVQVESDDVVTPAPTPGSPVATDSEFAAMLGRAIPTPRPLLPFHQDSALSDLDETVVGRAAGRALMRVMAKVMAVDPDDPSVDMVNAVMGQMPLRGIAMSSESRLSLDALDRMIGVLNRARSR